jgi:peptidoglycan/xylan/chitin deacetylase (PgdA/CDA1 family)
MADETSGRAVSRRAVIVAAAASVGLAACSRSEPGGQRAGPVPFGELGPAESSTPRVSFPPSSSYPDLSTEPPSPNTTSIAPDRIAVPTPSTQTPTSAPAGNHTLVDPAQVRANELGVIPVMMYHQIKPKITGPYDTTPRDFRDGLQRMFRAGYRPVRAIDLARGQLDVAAGYSPVVLTFDDGYSNQFRLQPDGTVDPSCAVGILLDVCRQFPSCRPAATLNINKNPFGLGDAESQAAGLTVLLRLGFEIGNHTYGHDNLAKMSVTSIERDFVLLQRLVSAAIPGLAVRTMALPYGSTPRSPRAASALPRGSWAGDRYVNEATFLAGANPSPSPFASGFDPQRVPRILSTSSRGGRLPLTLPYWLDYLAAHPTEKYVSGGRPGHVTVPAQLRPHVARSYADHVVTY